MEPPSNTSPSRLTFYIPNDSRLVGLRLTLQGVAKQPSGCYLLTDAVETELRF